MKLQLPDKKQWLKWLMMVYSFFAFSLLASSQGDSLAVFWQVAGENQLLERTEYKAWHVQNQTNLLEEQVLEIFAKTDLDKDGAISSDEFLTSNHFFNRNNTSIMEFQPPLIWLLLISLIMVSFFTFATHIFLKKMKELNVSE